MEQIARNMTGFDGELQKAKFLIHDRDGKFTGRFQTVFKSAGCETIKLPRRSPNLNAFAERWVRSIKDECLHRMIWFGIKAFKMAVKEYTDYFNHERNHQGIDNKIPEPDIRRKNKSNKIVRSSRIGGLLNFYFRDAA